MAKPSTHRADQALRRLPRPDGSLTFIRQTLAALQLFFGECSGLFPWQARHLIDDIDIPLGQFHPLPLFQLGGQKDFTVTNALQARHRAPLRLPESPDLAIAPAHEHDIKESD